MPTRAHSFLLIACSALTAWLAASAGCSSSPFALDDRIRKTAADGAIAAGLERMPEFDRSPPTPGARADQLRLQPGTANPPASGLSFTPADEARDVSVRLTSYSREAGVPIEGQVDAPGANVRTLDLFEALRLSQAHGREFLSAQEQYLLSAIDLLTTRRQWGPRLFNDTTLGLSGSGNGGDFSHTADLINRLRVSKRLPYGGSLEAQWVWNATEQLREQATGRYTQSSSLVLSGDVPLLRGAGQVAREDLIQAERNLVYAARSFERFRREYLVSIASDFYELLNARASIANQERQLESLRRNADRTGALVASGRLNGFERDIARSEVLSAEASLAGQRDQYILRLARFRVRLGLSDDQVLDVADAGSDLPEPEATMDQAASAALELRLDLQNQRDRLDDRRRALANARNGLLPDLNLRGSVTIPTDPDERVGGLAFTGDELDYSLSAALSLPLYREEERLRVRSAEIALRRAIRDYEQARDDVVVRVRAALRNVELARFQLTLAERQVAINERRKRAQDLQRNTIDAQRIVDTEIALASARNQRDRARTNLRIAVLNYLLESDQLRVARGGTPQPLPGMPGR
jgi:outer membrane protein TolC